LIFITVFLTVFKLIRILILLSLACWVVFTIVLIRENRDQLDLIRDLENSRSNLSKEEKYWETRFGQTLENEFEWQIVKELHLKDKEIKLLTLGKGLEGMLMVGRNGKIEDYDFKIVFDRNGLPIVTELVTAKVIRE